MNQVRGVIHDNVQAEQNHHPFFEQDVVTITTSWSDGVRNGSQTLNLSMAAAAELGVQLGYLFYRQRYVTGE